MNLKECFFSHLLLFSSLTSLAQTGLYTSTGSVSGVTLNPLTGYVGIGRNTPAFSLDVYGTVQSYGNLRTTAVGDGNGYYADDAHGSTIFSITRQPNNEARFQSYGYHTFYSGNNTGSEKMRIDSNGNVGIGITNPINLLDVNGVGRFRRQGSTTAGLTIGGDALSLTGWSTNNPYIEWRNSDNTRQGYFGWNTNRLSLVLENGFNYTIENGNVGIGTTNPTQKLTVKGTVYSTEVKVDVAAGNGPDYVFANSYQLPTLHELKTYIDQHKHLPEVPSAKEMEANGVNLGEMNLMLLKKIEELTLYVIDQRKELDEFKQRSVSPDLSGKKIEELTLYVIELKKEINELKNK